MSALNSSKKLDIILFISDEEESVMFLCGESLYVAWAYVFISEELLLGELSCNGWITCTLFCLDLELIKGTLLFLYGYLRC